MGGYILRRLFLVIPTLFGIMLINFALTQFVPGGPFDQIEAKLEGGGDAIEAVTGASGEDPGASGDSGYVGARVCRPSFARSWRWSSALPALSAPRVMRAA